MYLALYGPKGLVIFDHPYNAEYLRSFTEQGQGAEGRTDYPVESARRSAASPGEIMERMPGRATVRFPAPGPGGCPARRHSAEIGRG